MQMRKHLKTENIISVCLIALLGWVTTNLVQVKETQAVIVTQQLVDASINEVVIELKEAVIRTDTNMVHVLNKLDNLETQVI